MYFMYGRDDEVDTSKLLCILSLIQYMLVKLCIRVAISELCLVNIGQVTGFPIQTPLPSSFTSKSNMGERRKTFDRGPLSLHPSGYSTGAIEGQSQWQYTVCKLQASNTFSISATVLKQDTTNSSNINDKWKYFRKMVFFFTPLG